MEIDAATVDLVKQALLIALKIATPVLLSGILIGLVIAILQSVTSIQEQSLTLVPKIFAMTLVAAALLPWIIGRLADFSAEMFKLF
ncbi:MAG TPA: flagellar biosynthetic protein FliQ [Phycisphaerales bacterium]|nr:flagellar biosynthetic protein FliQ [Phycisphaerales bacterium]